MSEKCECGYGYGENEDDLYECDFCDNEESYCLKCLKKHEKKCKTKKRKNLPF